MLSERMQSHLEGIEVGDLVFGAVLRLANSEQCLNDRRLARSGPPHHADSRSSLCSEADVLQDQRQIGSIPD